MSHDLRAIPQSLEWNEDGNLLCSMTQDQMMHIFDPRITNNRKGITVATSHESSLSQKL
jgi:hypothetical protein